MKALYKYLARLLILTGFFLMVPVLVALYYREEWLIKYFLVPGILTMGAGYLLDKIYPEEDLNLTRAFMISAIAWLLIPLIGAVPFYLSLKISLLDAFFESTSGFTTTGLTVLTPSQLPKTVLFWRSFTQWIGGIGVILLFLAVGAPTGIARKLYVAEGRTERLEPSILRTADHIIFIYVLLTLLGVLALYLTGSSIFDSVNHVFTAIATGGFSTRDDSFATASLLERITAMAIMILGATSFALHQKWMSKDFRAVYADSQFRIMFLLIGLGAVFLLADGNALVDALFQSVSALTCTGLSTIDISSLGDFSKYSLLVLMTIGGGYGSTAGAIKLIRFIVIVKSVGWMVRKIVLPSKAIVPFKVAGKPMSEEDINTIFVFVFLYFVFILVGSMMLVKLGHPLIESFFQVASAQGNVGLSVLSHLSSIEKSLLIFHMWVGRIEIFPMLILFFVLLNPEKV
jgi:trk system potassium uptake protein TrkH